MKLSENGSRFPADLPIDESRECDPIAGMSADVAIYEPVTITGLGLTLTVMAGAVGVVVPPFPLRW
jgi:hypothetical protein